MEEREKELRISREFPGGKIKIQTIQKRWGKLMKKFRGISSEFKF